MLSFKPYILPFAVSFIICLAITPLIRKLAKKWGFLDVPTARKIHQKTVPRAGGVAIFLAVLITLILFYLLKKDLFSLAPWDKGDVFFRLVGLFIGSLFLVIAGLVDDKKSLSPLLKLIFQICAAVIAVSFGVSIEALNNPFGGQFWLNQIQISFDLFAHPLTINLIGDFLSVFWIVGLINVINWLDGLDGLADGISGIAALAIFFIALLPWVHQGIVAVLAAATLGGVLGFLPYNFNPAKIFMGDSGSQFLGFMLAAMSIIGGAKVATAFLVLGIPIFDGLWVFFRRIFTGKSPFIADRMHLHHRLLDLGLSQREVVVLLYIFSAFFALLGILSTTYAKLIAGILLLALLISFSFVIVAWQKKKKGNF